MHPADLLAILTPAQLFTSALANTLAIPCTATIGVLARTVGSRPAAAIAAATVTVAVLVGGIAGRIAGLLP